MRFPNRPAKGRPKRIPGTMNKLETSYSERLANRKRDGEVLEFWFESIKLKLAPSTFYTPDFLVMLADGTLEVHEAKGFWEDDARVKVKVAADTLPFRVVCVTWDRKAKDWVYENL